MLLVFTYPVKHSSQLYLLKGQCGPYTCSQPNADKIKDKSWGLKTHLISLWPCCVFYSFSRVKWYLLAGRTWPTQATIWESLLYQMAQDFEFATIFDHLLPLSEFKMYRCMYALYVPSIQWNTFATRDIIFCPMMTFYPKWRQAMISNRIRQERIKSK